MLPTSVTKATSVLLPEVEAAASEVASVVVLAAVNSYNPTVLHALIEGAVSFNVVDHSDGDGVRGPYVGPWPGLMRPMLRWETTRNPEALP